MLRRGIGRQAIERDVDRRSVRDRTRDGMINRNHARILLAAAVGLAGCAVRPRFLTINHPAPIVRARSVTRGEELPEQTVVPALITRLSDPDPVVRLSAHHALRKRTGKDFGFVPWAEEAERAQAIARWRTWWREHATQIAPIVQDPRAN